MIKKIQKLVRPFISVTFVLLTAYLAAMGKIPAKDVLYITGIIVAFHYGERAALKKPGE